MLDVRQVARFASHRSQAFDSVDVRLSRPSRVIIAEKSALAFTFRLPFDQMPVQRSTLVADTNHVGTVTTQVSDH